MKLNLRMLQEDLSYFGVESQLVDDLWTRPLKFATLTDGMGQPKGDRLYIVEASDIRAALADAPCTLNVLSIGKPPAVFLANNPHNIAWTSQSISRFDLLDRTNELFTRYHEWMESINDALRMNMPLRRLGERSEAIFGNPLWMWDSQLQTIFHVASEGRYALPERYQMHVDGDPWPVDEVNAINDDFRRSLKKHEPYVLPPMFGYHSLCYNLFTNNTYAATISVDGITGTFTDREYLLIKILGDIMAQSLAYQTQFSKHSTFIMSAQIEKLLAHGTVPTGKLAAALNKKRWSIDDPYFCIVAQQASNLTYPEQLLSPIAESICDTVQNMMFALTEGAIIFIANLSLTGQAKSEIPLIVQNHLENAKLHMKLGVSTVFRNFADLPYYREQADNALLLGSKHNFEDGIFPFEDYLLDSIVYRLKRDTVPEVLYPSCLLRLQQYDQEHRSDLTDTLVAYLDNSLSMNKTSQQLYMHRNTLLSRLKKIEEVGQLDFEDKTTRLLLRIALALKD